MPSTYTTTTYIYRNPNIIVHNPTSPASSTTSSNTMPHASTSGRVSFEPTPVYSRLPHDDEAYVIRAYSKHASHCDHCSDAYNTFRAGRTICSRGHRRAIDVAQYIFNYKNQAYSVVDREGSQYVQIELPPKAVAVRSLLKALERGLQLRPQTESQEKTYNPPKVQVHHSDSSSSRKHRPAPIYTGDARKSSGRTVYQTRGSLAEKDMKERERYYARRPYYYESVGQHYSPRPVAVVSGSRYHY